jgi:5-methyltetrahydropteroyltriglutamate--homocysteine methyltransferase
LRNEKNRSRGLEDIRAQMKPDHRVIVGVIAPIDPRIEMPEEVCERVLEAAEYIPVATRHNRRLRLLSIL